MAKNNTGNQQNYNRKKSRAQKTKSKQPDEISEPIEDQDGDLSLGRKRRVFIFSKDKMAPKSQE